jgi:hypothetical protein
MARADEAMHQLGIEAGLPNVSGAQHLARGGKAVNPDDGWIVIWRRCRWIAGLELMRAVLPLRGCGFRAHEPSII